MVCVLPKPILPDLTQKLAAVWTGDTVVTDSLGAVRSALDVFHQQVNISLLDSCECLKSRH